MSSFRIIRLICKLNLELTWSCWISYWNWFVLFLCESLQCSEWSRRHLVNHLVSGWIRFSVENNCCKKSKSRIHTNSIFCCIITQRYWFDNLTQFSFIRNRLKINDKNYTGVHESEPLTYHFWGRPSLTNSDLILHSVCNKASLKRGLECEVPHLWVIWRRSGLGRVVCKCLDWWHFLIHDPNSYFLARCAICLMVTNFKWKHTLEGDILRNCSCDFGERLSGLNRVPVNWRWKILRSESGLRRLMLVSSTCLSNLLAHFYESRDIALKTFPR